MNAQMMKTKEISSSPPPIVVEDEGKPGKVNSIRLCFENSNSNSSEFDCKEAIEDDLVGDGFFENLMNV